jgi:hypothetical protein
MSLSNEREPTLEERLRYAFTREAREERLLRGEHERQQLTNAIERAFGKQNKEEDGQRAKQRRRSWQHS